VKRQLFKAIERALAQRWQGRLPDILRQAKRALSIRMSTDDAYVEGYRAGYFDAVADMVAEDMVREPMQVPPVIVMPQDSDEVH